MQGGCSQSVGHVTPGLGGSTPSFLLFLASECFCAELGTLLCSYRRVDGLEEQCVTFTGISSLTRCRMKFNSGCFHDDDVVVGNGVVGDDCGGSVVFVLILLTVMVVVMEEW